VFWFLVELRLTSLLGMIILGILMEPIKVYHHFKTELIDESDRVSLVERAVHDLLMTSNLADGERESTVCWELKHSTSTAQFARILARKRNLPIDICSVGMMLHDIYSMVHGTYKDHAHRGAPLALDLLKNKGGFSDDELDQIYRLIYHHSDKHLRSDDPIEEFGKDVDVLDCFLYEGAFDFYLGNKPLYVFVGYLERAKHVWEELGLPPDPRFDILNGYGENWFSRLGTIGCTTHIAAIEELIQDEQPLERRAPPFCLVQSHSSLLFFGNADTWEEYRQKMLEVRQPLSDEAMDFLKGLPSGTGKPPENSTTNKETLDTRGQEGIWDFLSTGSPGDPHAVLLWSVVDIYEQLGGEKMMRRLGELGVDLEEGRR